MFARMVPCNFFLEIHGRLDDFIFKEKKMIVSIFISIYLIGIEEELIKKLSQHHSLWINDKCILVMNIRECS